MYCKKPCSSWWMYLAGLAKEDKPLCLECMQKLDEEFYQNIIEEMTNKDEIPKTKKKEK